MATRRTHPNLGDEDAAELAAGAKQFESGPPWTASGQAFNREFRQLLVGHADDDVPLEELAAVTGWTVPQVSIAVRAGRNERHVRQDTPNPIGQPNRRQGPLQRSLTSEEMRELVDAYSQLPTTSNGRRAWSSGPGQSLLLRVIELMDSGVSQRDICHQFGLSRQAIGSHLRAIRATGIPVTPKPAALNATDRRTLRRMHKQLPTHEVKRLPGQKKSARGVELEWVNPYGVQLLQEVDDLIRRGVDIAAIAAALDMSDPLPLQRQLSKLTQYENRLGLATTR